MDNDKSWLDGLKKGDEVAVWRSSYGSGYYELKPVEKVLSKHVVVGSSKFRRDTGRQAGETWHPAYLHQATDELKAQIANARRINQLAQKFNGIKWSKLPLETLKAIDELLSKN